MRTKEFTEDKIIKKGPQECWLWSGSLNTYGYGDVAWRGKRTTASRAAYEYYRGEIPAGHVICHKCDVPACCNPEHLFAGTTAENLADCRAKGRAVYLTGKNHHRQTAKLTEQQVIDAKVMHFQKGISQTEIARRYGVNSSAISRAVRGITWEFTE
jgi:hypothetical protein